MIKTIKDLVGFEDISNSIELLQVEGGCTPAHAGDTRPYIPPEIPIVEPSSPKEEGKSLWNLVKKLFGF